METKKQGSDSLATDEPYTELDPITVNVWTGNQLHQLYFALTDRLRSQVEEMVADFDPNSLEDHLTQWEDFNDIMDLFDQLVPQLNWYAEKLQQRPIDPSLQESRRIGKQRSFTEKIAYWQHKVRHHSALKSNRSHD